MTHLEAIPARGLPISARAPGKCILFGEHAVVHGCPELVLAIDLSTQVFVRPGARSSLNSDPDAPRTNPYLQAALDLSWKDGPAVDVRSVTRIPRAAGLGSSAAFVAALGAAMAAGTGGIDRAGLARRAFEIERAAQGVGSPGDTAASVAGGYVSLNGGHGDLLWSVSAGERRWEVRHVEDPRWVWVVAYSGVPRSTATAVRAVGERLARPDGPSLLEEFTEVAAAGIASVGRGDRRETGELLRRNQELLRRVGVSHPRLEELIIAAAPAAEAAKVTGAGAGGSIVALPIVGQEGELVRRLARAGAVPFAVRAEPKGAGLIEAAAPG